jgi:hypothetical protein
MKSSAVISALLLLLAIGPSAHAAAPAARLDAGNMLFYVDNDGSFGFDKLGSLNGYGGLYFPKNTLKYLMEGAGLWVAGKVDGEWRATLAGGPSEFVPGPAFTYDTNATEFAVYKITRGENYDLNEDYRNWPVILGAPVDPFGRPLIRGSQTLFTIFSDTDSSAHGFVISGTPPLGVEVHLSAYTWDNRYQTSDTILTQVAFLEYTITNVSTVAIDSFIATCYADPDIGYAGNDRIGSDSATGSCYCYNENDYDIYFGHDPPTVGICVLQGDLASANFYHSRSDYDTLTQTIYLMTGLDLTGQPYFDSTAMATTHYPYGGNPVTQTGWIGVVSHDYRVVLNLAPVHLEPGASTHLKVALILTQGSYYLDGITRFLQTAQMLQEMEEQGNSINVEVNSVRAFDASKPVQGRDWGGRFLGGGLDLASRYLDLPPRLDTLPLSALLFGPGHSQIVRRYIPAGDDYQYAGSTLAPFELDLFGESAPHDVLVIDTEDDGGITNSDGLLDPLIMTDRPITMAAQQVKALGSLKSQASALTTALELNESPESINTVNLVLPGNLMQEPFEPLCDTLFYSFVDRGTVVERTVRVTNPTRFSQEVFFTTDDAQHIAFDPSSLTLGTGESQLVFIRLSQDTPGLYLGDLTIASRGYSGFVRRVLVGASVGQNYLKGDINDDGTIDIVDIVRMVSILYRGSSMPATVLRADADCNGIFNLTDLIAFINVVLYNAETPCR